ncbi:MAG: protein-disulfide reductase DsbD [Thiobacillaceae bacterium]
MNYVTHLLVALSLSWGAVAHSQDFLEPEVAFKFSAGAPSAKTLEARWQIADGYYLYRQKFKFELTGGTLGGASYPAGKMKDDENFGKVEIYRKEVRVTLPFERAPGTTAVTLKATYQGCADAGLCYTPITQTQLIPLPSAPKAVLAPVAKPPAALPAQSLDALTKPAQSSSVLAGLRSLGSDPTPKILPPEEAFKAQAAQTDAQTVTVNYGLTDSTYLYRDKLGFAVKSPADITVVRKTLPQADVKEDPNFGRTEVYHHDFAVTLGLSRALKADETLVLEATYQGCNEKAGICYPPITTPFTLAAATAGVAPAPETPAMSQPDKPAVLTTVAATPGKGIPESDTSKIEKVLKGGSFWAVLATFFGFGLLLALTPCVFPMIPILSGIIAGQKKTPTKTNGFLLALAYVLGMAITYSLAGVAAALSGTLISNALQNPWALGVGALVFVALALSMFGFFELQLPSAIQSKFSDASNKMKGGSFVGVFVMGALSAVIVGPCVAPPLAAALAFIAQTGNTVLGGAALFVLALGMGVPLLLIGLSAGALLPKAGGWMNAVKYFFGVMMLAIAIYLISPIIPAWVNMLLWAMLLVASAVYLNALETLPHNASGWTRLWKACGVVLLAGGLALVLGMLGGSRDVLQPFAVYQAAVYQGGALKTASGNGIAEAAESRGIKFERVKSVAELDAKIAASAGREIMLDFYADWCVSCKEMERYSFNDPKVQARLKDVVLLQADVTATNDDSKALLKRFGLFGPPGMVFWNAQGVQSDYKVVGYEAPEKFLVSLGAAFGR